MSQRRDSNERGKGDEDRSKMTAARDDARQKIAGDRERQKAGERLGERWGR